MATRNQTRRSLSISEFLMDQLQKYASSNERNVSDIVEQEMRKFLGLPPRPDKPRKPYKNRPQAKSGTPPVRQLVPGVGTPVSSTFIVDGETELVEEVGV